MMATAATDAAKQGTCRIIDPVTGDVVILQMPEEAQRVPISIVGAFPPKQVIGDFQVFHHEFLSALIQTDWQGGGQITDSQEATDLSRYAGIATVESRYPRAVTLLPETTKVEGTNTTGAVLLGDLQQTFGGAIQFYAVYGTDLHRINGSAATDTTQDLTTAPLTSAVAFKRSGIARKVLWIPQGALGYQTWDPTGPTLSAQTTGTASGSTDVKPVNFCLWDRKLWALTTEGRVLRNVTGADDAWVEVLQLESEGDPTRLVEFVDQLGLPVLYAITTREVQVINVDADTAYPIIRYAPHPHAGTDAEWWREALWFTHGVDVGRYDRGTTSYVGLARDHGLPAEYRGHITDLTQGWNDLFALIEGIETESALTEGFATDLDADLLLGGSTSSLSILMRLDALGGWHTLWTSASVGKATTNVLVSAADSAYRIYWGFGGNVWYSELSADFQNPKQNPIARFRETGRIESSWFDMQKTGMAMDLAAVEVRATDCTATETLTISVQFEDETTAWETLGTISAAGTEHGMTRFLVGLRDTLPDGGNWYEGERFGRMRYAVDFQRDPSDATKSPELQSVALVYLTKMGTINSYIVPIDCSATRHRTRFGRGNRAVKQFLRSLIEEKFFPVNFQGNEWHVVKAAGVGFPGEETGEGTKGDATLTLVELFQDAGVGGL